MKVDEIFKRLNLWHDSDEIESQRCAIDNISISVEMNGSRINQPHVFMVSYRYFDPEREGQPLSQQYWGAEFKIRDNSGNPTKLGRMMGIKTRDRRITRHSPKGIAIEDFLYTLARKYAGKLTRGKQPIDDKYRGAA